MSFWKFINTGIGGTEDRIHVKFIYANAIISALASAVVAGISGWATGGNIVAIIISVFAAIVAVYTVSYIVFIEKSRTREN